MFDLVVKVLLLLLIAIGAVLLINIGLAGAEAMVGSACAYQFSSNFKELLKTINDNIQEFEREKEGTYTDTVELTIPRCTWGAAIYHRADTLRIVYVSQFKHAQETLNKGLWGVITGAVLAAVAIGLAVYSGGASLALLGKAGALIVATGAIAGGAVGATVGYYLTDYCVDVPFLIVYGQYENFRGITVKDLPYKMECGSTSAKAPYNPVPFDLLGSNTYKIEVKVSKETSPVKVTNLRCIEPCVECLGCE